MRLITIIGQLWHFCIYGKIWLTLTHTISYGKLIAKLNPLYGTSSHLQQSRKMLWWRNLGCILKIIYLNFPNLVLFTNQKLRSSNCIPYLMPLFFTSIDILSAGWKFSRDVVGHDWSFLHHCIKIPLCSISSWCISIFFSLQLHPNFLKSRTTMKYLSFKNYNNKNKIATSKIKLL